MSLVIGFRNQRYDNAEPLYATIGNGMVLNRLSKAQVSLASLTAAMTAKGYTPPAGEVGAPSAQWLAANTGWWSNAVVVTTNPPVIAVDHGAGLPITGDLANPPQPAGVVIDFTNQQLAQAHDVEAVYNIGAGDVTVPITLQPGMDDQAIADGIAFVLNQVVGLEAVSLPGATVAVLPDDGVTLTRLDVDIV